MITGSLGFDYFPIAAISVLLEESAGYKKLKAVPVLEEFIPLKKTCAEEKDDKAEDTKGEGNSSKEKMSWMSSFQLWNSGNSPNGPNADFSDNQSLEVENSKKV